MILDIVLLSVFLGTIVWVYFDAKAIGVKKGLIKGLGDADIRAWILSLFLLWIVFFPVYLFKRNAFMKINNSSGLKINKFLVGFVALAVIVLIAFVFLIPKSAPSCNDEQIKSTVIEIVKKNVRQELNTFKQWSGHKLISEVEFDKLFKPNIENIRQLNLNKDTGSYECAADLLVKTKEGEKTRIIRYTSELVQDKKGQFYVSVYGL